MKNKYFILLICTTLFLIIISISIYVFSNTNKKDDNLNDKINQEIEYVETKLLGMLNSLNNLTFSNSVLLEQNTINVNEESSDYTKYNIENRNILLQEDKPIDWSYLKNNVDVLYSTWPTIMIDLNTAGVNNDDILKFSNTLDLLILGIEKEDKKETLNDLNELYFLLTKYIKQTSDDIEKVNIFFTKSCVVKCYVLLEDNNWEEIIEQINKATEYYKNILNSTEVKKEQSLISKTYIYLNEIKNSVNLKDKKLFYLKYINFMENALEL